MMVRYRWSKTPLGRLKARAVELENEARAEKEISEAKKKAASGKQSVDPGNYLDKKTVCNIAQICFEVERSNCSNQISFCLYLEMGFLHAIKFETKTGEERFMLLMEVAIDSIQLQLPEDVSSQTSFYIVVLS